MLKILILSLFVTFITASIIREQQETSNQEQQETSNDYSRLFVSGNHDFSIRLYKILLSDRTSNAVLSPFGMSTLLTMVHLGARGKTAHEIRNALGYKGIQKSWLCDGFYNTMQSFKTSPDCVLNIANSIWTLDSFNVSTYYKERLVHYFDAEEHSFNAATGLNNINNWVRAKTNNNIPQLLSELSDDSVMLLLNAIYFKGPWKTSFDPNQNSINSFYGTETTSTTFMTVEDEFGYHESSALRSKILELPYKGEQISMIFVLPDAESSLEAMETDLTAENLIECLRNLVKQTVRVTIPKFEISSDFDLETSLRALGINRVFDNTANLGGISEYGELQVSDVLQKATLKVTEEGAEASAASAAIFYLRSATVSDAKLFTANRPFLYLLMHKPTETILFMGRFKEAVLN